MKATTLSFLVRKGEVLLAMKKRGFGVGKWNGVGGKLKEGEDVARTAIREIKEEIDVDVLLKDLKSVATLNFRFEGNPNWDQVCHVFLIEQWEGEPSESEEMKPQWFRTDALPFENMWVDDPHWLPKVLAGDEVDGEFLFDREGVKALKHEVTVRP